ncbi:hypothetical protein VUR80DRAFT_6424 [Thermomyces stellatus]
MNGSRETPSSNTSAKETVSSFHRFFDLPPELRTQILIHLVPTRQTLPLSSPASHPPLSLLLSHPLVYAPVSHAFFAFNTFAASPDALASVPAPTRRRIRNLVLELPRLREVHVSAVAPRLSDALLNGSLRSLVISLRDAGVSLPRNRGGELPWGLCRTLVELLSDPYLEVAELWVGGVHKDGWCEFHPGTGCYVQGRSRARRPVKIDWGLMAARMGESVKIVAVGR